MHVRRRIHAVCPILLLSHILLRQRHSICNKREQKFSKVYVHMRRRIHVCVVDKERHGRS
jgi:hypothetical protein